MPHSYNIDMEVGCVFVKAWGKISNQELIDYLNQIYNEPILPKPFKKLVDLSDVTDFNICYANAVKSRDVLSRYNEKRKHGKTAVFSASDVIYGISRMLGSINSDIVNTQTFRDINEAFEFLNILPFDYTIKYFNNALYARKCVA